MPLVEILHGGQLDPEEMEAVRAQLRLEHSAAVGRSQPRHERSVLRPDATRRQLLPRCAAYDDPRTIAHADGAAVG